MYTTDICVKTTIQLLRLVLQWAPFTPVSQTVLRDYLKIKIYVLIYYRRSIMTQFKSTYARRAFPCYDEPSYKAKFHIKVVRRKDQIALSNMPIKKTVS